MLIIAIGLTACGAGEDNNSANVTSGISGINGISGTSGTSGTSESSGGETAATTDHAMRYTATSQDGTTSQTIALDTNTNYNISVDLMVETGSAGKSVFDTDDRFDSSCQWTTPASDWLIESCSFNSGSFSDVKLRMFVTPSFSGRAFFDNIVLTRQGSSTNLVTNGDFENGTTGWNLPNGNFEVVVIEGSGGDTGGGGDNGGGSNGDNDGSGSSSGRFSAPSAALYSLNNSTQRVFPKHIDSTFGGNGATETWDGRIFVRTRSAGWFASAFRPENIGLNSDGTPNFGQGAFGDSISLELKDEAPDVKHNWLAITPDPELTSENPYPSNANGDYQQDGTHRTYKVLVYHTSNRDGDTRQMGLRKATFIVSNANTSTAQVETADFTSSFSPLKLADGADFLCIEPSVTMDARLVICQGHPNNDGTIDNLVYSWTDTPGSVSNWAAPKSIADMYHDDRNTDVAGLTFSVRYPIAENPVTDATGNEYVSGELVKGAYPWVSHDGSEVFYQASNDGMSARRTGTSVVGRWTGGTIRHIDGPINRNRHITSRLFLSSPGAFTTMWSPYKDLDNLAIPYSVRGPSYPLFGSNSEDYMEIGFDDYLDGNYVLYLGMNEQLNRAGDYQVNDSNDTSGNFNNASLVGAKFPLEYDGTDELVGRYGQAIYFASDTHLEVDRNNGWGTLEDGVTVDFFIYKLQSGSGRIQLFNLEGGVELYLDNATNIVARIEDQSGNSVTLSGPAIDNQQWVHVAFTYSPVSQKMVLYVNGSSVADHTASGFGELRTSGSVRIGPENSQATMLLDEVKVSNIARRAYEIAHNANAGVNKPASQALLDTVPDHLASLLDRTTSVDRFSMDAASLGEDLFSDVILSKQRTTSCATCHKAAIAFTDGLAMASGNEPTDAGVRNTPMLLNRLFSSLQGWSGSADSLDTQALIPIPAVHEMNLPLSEAVQRLLADSTYAGRFQQVYGEPVDAVNLAAALASFEAIQYSPENSVDQYKQGVLSALNDAELRGLTLFEGKARCSGCHAGTNFTDESFRGNGLALNDDIGRAEMTGRDRDYKLFKVPSLRSVGNTAPYMHDGSIDTLSGVVTGYDLGSVGVETVDTDIRPLELSAQEKNDLVQFLLAL